LIQLTITGLSSWHRSTETGEPFIIGGKRFAIPEHLTVESFGTSEILAQALCCEEQPGRSNSAR
jgi:hypothetical protein